MAITLSGTTGITNVDGSASVPANKGTTSSTAGMFFPAANTVAFSTSSTEAMRIDASQNVGIGTSSPSYTVTLQRTAAANNFLQFSASTGDSVAGTLIGRAGSNLDLRIQQSENANITFWTNNTERMRIDTSGNVGIGTSSPNGKLEVNNSTVGAEVSRFEGNYTGSGSVVLTNWRRSGGAVAAVMRYNDANNSMAFGTTTAHPQVFLTNNTEAARIDSSANFYFNSGYGSSAVAYGCRAWLNYNLSTQTTRGSGNISSVTYNSTGYLTLNFTNSLPDANYAITGSGEWTSGTTSATYVFVRNTTPPTTTNCPLVIGTTSGFSNPTWIGVQIVR